MAVCNAGLQACVAVRNAGLQACDPRRVGLLACPEPEAPNGRL